MEENKTNVIDVDFNEVEVKKPETLMCMDGKTPAAAYIDFNEFTNNMVYFRDKLAEEGDAMKIPFSHDDVEKLRETIRTEAADGGELTYDELNEMCVDALGITIPDILGIHFIEEEEE